MNAVVYTSQTGFTAEYAKMLGEKTGLPVYTLPEAVKKLDAGSGIIYLGWLMAGSIKGYKKAAKRFKVGLVCGVGMGQSGSQAEDIRKRNTLGSTPAFVLQGGFDISKLHGIYRLMMSAMSKSVSKNLSQKADKTTEDLNTLDLMQNGGSRVSLANLEPVLKWWKENAK